MAQNGPLMVPKIKKVDFKSKILLDPADLRKGLPKSKLPQLTNDGLILSLQAMKAPPAKLSYNGSLKFNIKYIGHILQLKGRYVEVKYINNIDDVWVGTLFGITVNGKGGDGSIRGCKVIGIKEETIQVQYISEGGNQIWKKLQKKVRNILEGMIQ